MYQLNGNIIYGNKVILTNPQWQLERVINGDDRIAKAIKVSVELSVPDAGPFHMEAGIYDYSEKGTWEDQDLEDFVKSLPDFKNSTIIEE